MAKHLKNTFIKDNYFNLVCETNVLFHKRLVENVSIFKIWEHLYPHHRTPHNLVQCALVIDVQGSVQCFHSY